MKIAILDDYQDVVRQLDCFRMLDGHQVRVFNHSARGIGQLAIRLAPFDALVLIRERSVIGKGLLDKLPNLKLISQTGKVSGHIDVAAATQCGVTITEGVGDPTAPAELTWALIMAASRKIPQYAGHLKQGLWQTAALAPQHNTLGTALKGRTLGIWGYGKIGRLIAGYGRAFGMRVLVWGRDASLAAAGNDGHHAAASKQAFFAEADVVSLHLRLNDATRGIVTAADLACMKPGALAAALAAGRPGFAALDVFESEPLAPDAPLLCMPNVLATPHLGYVEHDSYELYFRAAFRNVLDFADGRPHNVLNPEACA